MLTYHFAPDFKRTAVANIKIDLVYCSYTMLSVQCLLIFFIFDSCQTVCACHSHELSRSYHHFNSKCPFTTTSFPKFKFIEKLQCVTKVFILEDSWIEVFGIRKFLLLA